jgi:hypothetical protein
MSEGKPDRGQPPTKASAAIPTSGSESRAKPPVQQVESGQPPRKPPDMQHHFHFEQKKPEPGRP